MNLTAWIALGSALLLATTASAQVVIEPPNGGGGGSLPIAPPTTSIAPPTKPAATAPATSLPSAENVLQQMLNTKPIPAIGPGGGAAAGGAGAGTAVGDHGGIQMTPVGPAPGPDGLLREGQQIELRSGHLKKDDGGAAAPADAAVTVAGAGGMLFVFDPKDTPAYPPMGVVPSRRLAAMEDAAGFDESHAGSDMTFRITAEVTQYRGKNYLYIKPSGIPVPPPLKPVATAPAPLVNAAAPRVPETAPLPQGNIITNRIGRLVRDAKTGAELIAFDADGKLMTDAPMGVIPCKYLAVIEDATDRGNKPLKFRLSGEVTTYRGRNYLYLKFVQQVRDLNQGIGAGVNAGG